MKNEYGLDAGYMGEKLRIISRDIDRYKPDEFARQLMRLACAADQSVINENEFNRDREGFFKSGFIEGWTDRHCDEHADETSDAEDSWENYLFHAMQSQ